MSSIEFFLASALALFLFVTFANLVVVQYGRGAVRSALEQGARAGTVGGVESCESTATQVIEDLLGGRMSDDLVLGCRVAGPDIVAEAEVTFRSWTPLTPDFPVVMSSRAVIEP